MRVEENSGHQEHFSSLATKSFEMFRQIMVKCYRLLPSQFVKVDTLEQIIPKTVLADRNLPEKQRNNSVIAIVDLDGIIIKPPHSDTCRSLLPLREIEKRVDSLYISTSRFSVDENSWFWKNIGHFFKTGTAVSCFPFLTKQEAKNFETYRESGKGGFPPKGREGQTKILCGFKGISNNGHKGILGNLADGNTDVIHVGSSFMDYFFFEKMLKHLKDNQLPTDRLVFCYVGHNLAL